MLELLQADLMGTRGGSTSPNVTCPPLLLADHTGNLGNQNDLFICNSSKTLN